MKHARCDLIRHPHQLTRVRLSLSTLIKEDSSEGIYLNQRRRYSRTWVISFAFHDCDTPTHYWEGGICLEKGLIVYYTSASRFLLYPYSRRSIKASFVKFHVYEGPAREERIDMVNIWSYLLKSL